MTPTTGAGAKASADNRLVLSTNRLGSVWLGFVSLFPPTFKDRAATMSPETGENRSFWIADVPWTQYFSSPFALHAAFWHERFGEPTSAGCINVSPIDAEALFQWSDPQVPDEWQGFIPKNAEYFAGK